MAPFTGACRRTQKRDGANPDITYKEQAIKDTSYILAKMLSENAVEWIRGRVEQDPVALMEKAIAAVDGVGQVLLNNLNKNYNNK